MEIGRKDIFWNYAATFLKIASSALLFPFALKVMSVELVGIWSVFISVSAFAMLLDFGFNPSFARNVTYVFSGATVLRDQGFEPNSKEFIIVDYKLLKGVIIAMRWFYLRMAIILFILLATVGTYFIHALLENYTGEKREVYIAWILLCMINTYNLYTLYFDSLLLGKGLVKRSKQIVILGQLTYILIGTILLTNGYGLIAIVLAQASSVLIIRWLSYYSFFSKELKFNLDKIIPSSQKQVLKAIYPNALKIGLTSLGSFLVQRSAILIGSLYLPLNEIGSYGITTQLISVLAVLSTIYTATYQPRIVQLRVMQNNQKIKDIYLRGQLIMFLTYLIGGIVLLQFGEWALVLIGSSTHLIPTVLGCLVIIISFLESNHSIAGGILLTKNEVPFFKAALFSGGLTVVFLMVFFQFTNLGLLGMIIAPGIAQGIYQNWKWPKVVIEELKISQKDILKSIVDFLKFR